MRTSPGLWWPKPEAGDIVWCQFPHLPNLEPGPKPRPALVVRVIERNPHYRVLVAYGTSQKTTSLRRGEFLLRKDASAAFKLSGLGYDTKFSFADSVELDYSDHWFKVPPGASGGVSPKLGVLHAVYGKAAYAAYLATKP
ncbi:MAG: type II toxin-antitoxin system PemK/MazF family toxin [Burkholderiaceae bacterium]